MRDTGGACGRLLALSMERQACVAACLGNLYGSNRVWYGSYAEIRTDKCRLSSNFYAHPHPRPIWETNCFVAPGYVVPREAFDRIGGWSPLQSGWGQTEISLAVRLWLAGVPILLDQGAKLLHMFRDKFNYRVSNREVLRNNYIMCRVCFDKKTFDGFWHPLMQQHRHWPKDMVDALDHDALQQEAEAFGAVKVRSDADWFRAVLDMSLDDAKKKYLK